VWNQLRDQLGGLPTVALVFGHCSVDAAFVAEKLSELQPSLTVIGSSSMHGFMTPNALARFGIMGFRGWAKRCGIGYAKGSEITDDHSAQEAGRKAMSEATQGRAPDIVLMFGTPGREEHILTGINKVCKGVRVFGGTSSNQSFEDEKCSPAWQMYGDMGGWGAINDGGFVLLAIWQKKHSRIHSVLSHCYGSTEHTGMITHAFDRNIYEIDNRPAGDVFSSWTGVEIPCSPKDFAEYALAFDDDDHVVRLVKVKSVGKYRELQCYASTACEFGISSARLVRIKPATLMSSVREVARKAQEDVEFTICAALVLISAATTSFFDEDDFSQMQAILKDVAPEVVLLFTFGAQGKGSSHRDAFHNNGMLSFLFFG